MAKFTAPSTDQRFVCQHCGGKHDVQIEQSSGASGFNTTVTIKKLCQCDLTAPPYANNNSWLKPKAKEPEVTKEFDTTANKSAALNAILNRVEDVERALYARVEARIRLETEHNAKIAEASAKLNRVLAESIHMGIEEEDLELYLPDHEEFLAERLIQVANEMSLANVLETV